MVKFKMIRQGAAGLETAPSKLKADEAERTAAEVAEAIGKTVEEVEAMLEYPEIFYRTRVRTRCRPDALVKTGPTGDVTLHYTVANDPPISRQKVTGGGITLIEGTATFDCGSYSTSRLSGTGCQLANSAACPMVRQSEAIAEAVFNAFNDREQ